MTRIDLRLRKSEANPERAHAYRALLDGEDVSDRCFLSDDVEGVVGLYLRDSEGHFYRDGDDAAHEFRKGIVTLIPSWDQVAR
jgi:hypothetical protein